MLTKLIGKLALFCTIIVKNVALLGQSNLFSMFAVIYGMPLLNKNFINKVRLILELLMNIGMIITLETKVLVRDLSEISRGGGGVKLF